MNPPPLGLVTPPDPLPPAAERIKALAGARDIVTMQRLISAEYGFKAPARYCQDLIVFVEAMERGPPSA